MGKAKIYIIKSLTRKAMLCVFCIYSIFRINLSFGQNLNSKEVTAKKVFNSISYAYGSVMHAPNFELVPKGMGKRQLLMYYPGDRPVVRMDEEVYDQCISFGKDSLNALAALLGHELAHHYEKHDWCSSFSFLLGADNSLIKSITNQDKNSKQRLESEADYYGCFYGYVAGFDTYALLPRLLDKLYSAYKIPDNIPGYPTKAERIEIAQKRMDEIKKWTGVFDAGEFLFALKQFNLAGSCFIHLSKKFPSREIYNNAGVCFLYYATSFIKADELPFVLPIEFDPTTHLKSSVRSANISASQKKDSIFHYTDLAVNYFEKAKRVSQEYFTVELNIGISHLLKQNSSYALGIAKQLIQWPDIKSNKVNHSNAYTLKAIAEWQGKNNEAGNSFAEAAKLNHNLLTIYNEKTYNELNKSTWQSFINSLYLFLNSEEENQDKQEKSINPLLEKISDKNPKTYVPNISSTIKNTVTQDEVIINQYEDVNYISIIVNNKINQYNFICTKSNYDGKSSQGVKIGSKEEQLKDRYGSPSEILNVPNGYYYIFKKAKVVFHVNLEGKVTKWFLYNSL
jgi:hypothetical protein